MIEGADPLPATAQFESLTFPVAVIVVWRHRHHDDGWHAETVLYRDGSAVAAQPPWEEPFLDSPPRPWADLWEYLAERVREGRGGNAYTYEIEAFEVADPSHITPLVTARATEIAGASHGPFGETAGTILFGDSPDDCSIVMPFVLLANDRGQDALVATTSLDQLGEASVRAEQGMLVDPVAFESLEHWRQQDFPSWPLQRQVPYIVHWNGHQVRVVVAEGGGYEELGPLHRPARIGGSDETDVVNQGGALPNPVFAIQRVPAPEWIMQGLPLDHAAYEDATGGQLEWSFATPWVFKALASPLTHEPILTAPQPGASEVALAYWSALLNLLIYSFGWARPDRGLRWWYDAGKPTDDPRLQLISQVWEADGQLDWFAAWLWTTPSIFESELLSELTGYHDDGSPVPVDEVWIETTRAVAAASGVTAPIGDGGWDELHLSQHSSGPLGECSCEPRLLRSSRTERRATLMLDSMIGWYRAVAVHGALLPELEQKSWRLDVVVRPVGHLGTYRRSRTTGLWFSGHHRHHLHGT